MDEPFLCRGVCDVAVAQGTFLLTFGDVPKSSTFSTILLNQQNFTRELVSSSYLMSAILIIAFLLIIQNSYKAKLLAGVCRIYWLWVSSSYSGSTMDHLARQKDSLQFFYIMYRKRFGKDGLMAQAVLSNQPVLGSVRKG